MAQVREPIIWQTFEHIHVPKSSDWYWIVGIIGTTAAIVAFIFGNFLFGLILIVSTFALLLFGARPPRLLEIEISKLGVRVNNELFPYRHLRSFSVDEEDADEEEIIVYTKTLLNPTITLPLHPEISAEEVRDFLLDHLDEEHHEHSFSETLIRYFGL